MKDEVREEMKKFENSSKTVVETILENTLEKIRFLEQVYRTWGKNNLWRWEEFWQAAYKERERFCITSSACYELLRKF